MKSKSGTCSTEAISRSRAWRWWIDLYLWDTQESAVDSVSNIAIRVEGLGKRYRIGGKQERYKTLHGPLADRDPGVRCGEAPSLRGSQRLKRHHA